jgi:hypothetical protein
MPAPTAERKVLAAVRRKRGLFLAYFGPTPCTPNVLSPTADDCLVGQLGAQFGSQYAETRLARLKFKKDFERYRAAVLVVYRDANVEATPTGVALRPSRTTAWVVDRDLVRELLQRFGIRSRPGELDAATTRGFDATVFDIARGHRRPVRAGRAAHDGRDPRFVPRPLRAPSAASMPNFSGSNLKFTKLMAFSRSRSCGCWSSPWCLTSEAVIRTQVDKSSSAALASPTPGHRHKIGEGRAGLSAARPPPIAAACAAQLRIGRQVPHHQGRFVDHWTRLLSNKVTPEFN